MNLKPFHQVFQYTPHCSQCDQTYTPHCSQCDQLYFSIHRTAVSVTNCISIYTALQSVWPTVFQYTPHCSQCDQLYFSIHRTAVSVTNCISIYTALQSVWPDLQTTALSSGLINRYFQMRNVHFIIMRFKWTHATLDMAVNLRQKLLSFLLCFSFVCFSNVEILSWYPKSNVVFVQINIIANRWKTA